MPTLEGTLTDEQGRTWRIKSSLVSEDWQRASFVCDQATDHIGPSSDTPKNTPQGQ